MKSEDLKVLYVCSGNKKTGISPIALNQGESLSQAGVSLEYFPITGKGLSGYFKNILYLRRKLKSRQYNVVHANYSLSAFAAALTFTSVPKVASLMGSDLHMNKIWRFIISFNILFFWKEVLVKSSAMKYNLKLNKAHVIPNGVDMDLFRPIDKTDALNKVKFDPAKKHVVFLSDPSRPEKNWKLAVESVRLLKNDSAELHAVYNVSRDLIPYYLSAADCLLLTSSREGSPNAVKEALACNCPVISTDVGDVRERIMDIEGCYICSQNAEDISGKLGQVLSSEIRINGREKIKELDSRIVAGQIIKIYKSML